MTDGTESLTERFWVGEDDTAAAVGSGSLAVLGTPRLLAWMEAVTCEAVARHLGEGQTSVGTRIDIEHLAPSAVGGEVEVHVSPAYVDGRLHRFAVAARSVVEGRATAVVASGEITRVIVDADRFMARVTG